MKQTSPCSQAPPGNTLLPRLRRGDLSLRFDMKAKPSRRRIPRQSLGTRQSTRALRVLHLVTASCLLLTAYLTLPARADEPVARRASDGRLHIDSVVLSLIDQVEVSARQAGVLDEIPVAEGQAVEKGQLLARLEDTEAKLALAKTKLQADIAKKEAESDVKIRYAKKSLDVAAAEEKRALDSSGKFKQSVSQTELDELRLAKERAALEAEQAAEDRDIAKLTAALKQNEVETAEYNLDRCHIVSPLTGVVVSIKRHQGEALQPGDSVMRIVRTDPLRVEAFLNSREIGGDLVGRPVVLTVDLPERPKAEFPGSIVYVSPEVNPVSGQFRVWAQIANPDKLLRPGLQGSMTIVPAGQ